MNHEERKIRFPILGRIYLFEILRGMTITLRHLVRNLFNRKQMVIIEYPDERREYSPRFRGRHRLKKREDGTVKCVACHLCATVCPAQCITIEATEHPDPDIEKMPEKYEMRRLFDDAGLDVGFILDDYLGYFLSASLKR